MEELLNKLIEKGWKPFGKNAIKISYSWMETCCWYWAITYKYRDSYIDDYWDKVEYEERQHQFNIRRLTSKESWLWQFVCENRMINHKGLDIDIHSWEHTTAEHSDFWFTDWDNYEYYIIESALCNEDDLEQFLLDNIKSDF